MASYEQLLSHFKQTAPPGILAKEGTPEFGDIFNKWAEDVMKEFGVDSWDAILAEQLAELDWNPDFNGPTTTRGPAEAAIFNQVAPGLAGQIAGDAGRQAQVTNLSNQTNTAYGNLSQLLGQSAMAFDGQAYFRANPDVAAAFAANPEGMTPAQYAQRHYTQYGQNEGRTPVYTSGVLAAQQGNIDSTTQAIINAANTSAGAQGTALTALTAEQLANLTQSLTTRTGALSNLTASQLTNLQTSLATQQKALQDEVASLQGNATAAAAARRAALATQMAQLQAAQAPVSQARIRAADSEVTGINLGLESTRDQLAADANREGFVGPSSMSEAALARASIDARQGAARTMGGARIANASDDRAIAGYGANQGYSIEDVLAGRTQEVGDYGASGRARLTSWGAETGRGINDTGAKSLYDLISGGAEAGRGIRDTGATGRFSLAAELARQEQAARVGGATASAEAYRSLYPNALNAAQLATRLPGDQATALAGLIPYGNAGTRDALGILNWWQTGGTPPSSTAVTRTPSNTGNQIAGLGANLLGTAFQIGGANNWWRPPTTPPRLPPTTTNAAIDL